MYKRWLVSTLAVLHGRGLAECVEGDRRSCAVNTADVQRSSQELRGPNTGSGVQVLVVTERRGGEGENKETKRGEEGRVRKKWRGRKEKRREERKGEKTGKRGEGGNVQLLCPVRDQILAALLPMIYNKKSELMLMRRATASV